MWPIITDIEFVNEENIYSMSKPKYAYRIGKPEQRLSFCIYPRRCRHSGKSLWLRKSYQVRRFIWLGDSYGCIEKRYYDEHEYLKLKLAY